LNRFHLVAALSLLLPASLSAQTAASIQVLSDSSQVLVGRTMQFRAVARDSGGNLLRNAVVTWSLSSNAAIGSIDSSGVFTARGLGTLRVAARSGSVTAETAIQTIPSRVAISPERAEVAVGGTLPFTATAFDADNRPIPGVNWSWSITNLRQGTSQTARVTNVGMMSAIAEGSNLVFATYNYGDVQTGLQRQWIANARVETTVPRSYTVKRVFHNLQSMRSNFNFRARQSMLWSTDEGDLFFNASLDGMAAGLVNLRDGQFKLTSAAGMPRFASGSFANEYFTHSIARNGKVLTYEDTNINGRQLNLGDRNGVIPFFSNNQPLEATIATGGIVVTRNSMSSTGQMIVRATFRFEDDPVTYTGLFRAYNFKIMELLVSTKERLPELGTAAFNVDGDFGIADDGTAYYALSLGANRIIYRHPPSMQREKWLAVNDEFAGSTIRRFPGGRGNHPTFWVDEANHLVACVELNNNQTFYVSIAKDGKRDSLQLSGQSGILWHHPLHGTLIHANPFNNRGNGVYLWKPGSDLRNIFLYSRPQVSGTNIEDVDAGTINSKGEIFLMGRTSTINMGIVKMSAEPEWLLWSDMQVSLEAPLNLITLIAGGRVGPPHLLAGGTTGSITEFNGSTLTPRVALGERLFGNNMWYGGFHGGTANMRKASNGDIYFISPVGIARIVGNGSPELVQRFPLTIGTMTVNNPGQLEVNGRGDILFNSSTNQGDSRFFVLSNGTVSQILAYSGTANTANTIDGRIASGFDNFTIDEAGRVIATLRFRNLNVPVLYQFAAQTWTRMAEANLTRIGPHLITGISSLNRPAGTRLFSALGIQGGGNILCEWKGSEWEIIVNNSTIMPNGQVANSITAIEANRNGDVLFQQSNGGNDFLLVRRADGSVRQVINRFRPTADGDYLVRFNAIDFRDDGTVYFLAMTADDETVLYEARPN
jgi:hypothetical protein